MRRFRVLAAGKDEHRQWSYDELALCLYYQISSLTSSHFPSRRREIFMTIFHYFGTNCMVLSEWEQFLLLVSLWRILKFQVSAVFPATTFRTTNKYPPMHTPVPTRSCSYPTHLLSARRRGTERPCASYLRSRERKMGKVHFMRVAWARWNTHIGRG